MGICGAEKAVIYGNEQRSSDRSRIPSFALANEIEAYLHSDPLLFGSRLRLLTHVAFSGVGIGLGHHPDPGEWHLKENKIDPASGLKVYGVCLRQGKNRVTRSRKYARRATIYLVR